MARKPNTPPKGRKSKDSTSTKGGKTGKSPADEKYPAEILDHITEAERLILLASPQTLTEEERALRRKLQNRVASVTSREKKAKHLVGLEGIKDQLDHALLVNQILATQMNELLTILSRDGCFAQNDLNNADATRAPETLAYTPASEFDASKLPSVASFALRPDLTHGINFVIPAQMGLLSQPQHGQFSETAPQPQLHAHGGRLTRSQAAAVAAAAAETTNFGKTTSTTTTTTVTTFTSTSPVVTSMVDSDTGIDGEMNVIINTDDEYYHHHDYIVDSLSGSDEYDYSSSASSSDDDELAFPLSHQHHLKSTFPTAVAPMDMFSRSLVKKATAGARFNYHDLAVPSDDSDSADSSSPSSHSTSPYSSTQSSPLLTPSQPTLALSMADKLNDPAASSLSLSSFDPVCGAGGFAPFGLLPQQLDSRQNAAFA